MKINTYSCSETRHGATDFAAMEIDALRGCQECDDDNPKEMFMLNMDSSSWAGCSTCAENHYSFGYIDGQQQCVCDVCSGFDQD